MKIGTESAELLAVKPNVVLFDLDNTLYEYNTCHVPALNKVFQEFGIHYGIDNKLIQQAYAEARALVKVQTINTAACHSRLLYFQRTSELLGFGSQTTLSLQLEQIYWRTYFSMMEIDDGASRFIEYLRCSGIKLGIVTDLTSQVQFRKLQLLRMVNKFDFVVTSEETGSEKATGVPYELASKKFGLGASDVVWMIGDSVVDAVPAKVAINAVTLHFHKFLAKPIEEPTDIVFKDFSKLQHFCEDNLI
jgi:HAD superfamily hydrolase (TIGR01549 family)